jgi:hypothetical protein
MPEYYHVRINPKRTDVMTDFSIFFTEILVTREGRWDKDSKNRIVVGDYLGFITGPVGEEVVYIYKVEREGTADERPSHWASATPYTSNNGQTNTLFQKHSSGVNSDPLQVWVGSVLLGRHEELKGLLIRRLYLFRSRNPLKKRKVLEFKK